MSTEPPNADSLDETPETHLEGLGDAFMAALRFREAGRADDALAAFAAVLRTEPRLAEPRMEIARIYLEMGRLEEAEVEAREAVRILTAGGAWTVEIPEATLLAMAWAIVGAILKEQAASDDVVFAEDPGRFADLIAQSSAAFAKAAELDPDDTVSALNAAELGDIEDEDGN